jgi:hypothetical protein
VDPQHVTADWLTTRLAEVGDLDGTIVESIEVGESFGSSSITLTPLKIGYVGTPPAIAPRRLLWKEYVKNWESAGRVEVTLYSDLVRQMRSPPVANCYFAQVEEVEARSFLLLEDISSTHVTLPENATIEDFVQIAETLADLHARWWDDPRISEPDFLTPQGGPLRMAQINDAETVDDQLTWLTARWDETLAERQDVPEDWVGHCGRAGSIWRDAVVSRAVRGQITLIHGDTNAGNVFLPRHEDGSVRLLDWETYKRGIGVFDVMCLLMSLNDPDRRRSLEQPMLERYLARLTEMGVADYGWDELTRDVHLAILANVFPPMLWERIHIGEGAWGRGTLASVMSAYEDWECDTFIDEIEVMKQPG